MAFKRYGKKWKLKWKEASVFGVVGKINLTKEANGKESQQGMMINEYDFKL